MLLDLFMHADLFSSFVLKFYKYNKIISVS